jgi:hypothetical protein
MCRAATLKHSDVRAFPPANAFQVIPSKEYAIAFPVPAATHRESFHAIEFTDVKRALPEGDSVQFIPSEEYAIFALLPLPPPATHKEPFHAIARAPNVLMGVKIELPELDSVQLIPFEE